MILRYTKAILRTSFNTMFSVQNCIQFDAKARRPDFDFDFDFMKIISLAQRNRERENEGVQPN